MTTTVTHSSLNRIRHNTFVRKLQRSRPYEPIRFSIPAVKFAASNPKQQYRPLVRWFGSWLRPSRDPWLSFEVMQLIEAHLNNCSTVPKIFEYGAGFSTLWLISHPVFISSVESDEAWYSELLKLLPRTDRLTLHFVPPSNILEFEGGCMTSEVAPGCFNRYVHKIDGYPDETFDLVIVDGFARNECLQIAKPKIKPGGYVYLDDAQRERYNTGLAHYGPEWERTYVTGLRPRSLPNTGLFLRRPL